MNRKYTYLMAEVDLPTGEPRPAPNAPLPLRRVGPGMVSTLGLTAAEIRRIPASVFRQATVEEMEAADAAEESTELEV